MFSSSPLTATARVALPFSAPRNEYVPTASSQLTPLSSFTPLSPSTNYQSQHASMFKAESPTSEQDINYFSYTSMLNDNECTNSILLNNQVSNLQQQLQTAQNDLSHLRGKYQQALKDCRNAEIEPQMMDTDEYTPYKGFRIPKANPIIQVGLTAESVKPGYCQFGGEGSNVMVPVKWLALMKAKTKMAGASHALKKYMDGFFNPWEMQGVTAKSIQTLTGDRRELFDALQLFASMELNLNTSKYHRALITKAGTSRRTMQEVYPEQALPKKTKFSKKII